MRTGNKDINNDHTLDHVLQTVTHFDKTVAFATNNKTSKT